MQLGSIARWLKGDSRFWEGERFTVAVEGRGERDVVFVHGLAASPECWEEGPARLGPDLRQHFVHMRGFSGLPPTGFRESGNFLKPTADALAAYIRANCRGPAAVVGHSMGGILSLILARDHADVVERLMVVDVPAFFSVLINPFATPKTVASLADASRRNYLEKSKTQLEDDLRRATEKLVVDGGMLERIVRWGMTSDRATTADVMAEVMVTDLRGDLHLIQAPVEVVHAWDKSGHATKVALDQVYASAYHGLARGRRLRIDHARHYVMLDQPEVFYNAVRDWLAR
ncbi:MAG TPA: alpha/beta hydrolase [Hyphomonadaceae bacterium]|jgi:pimeloyl-ACP methyl ester carboxylesterase